MKTAWEHSRLALLVSTCIGTRTKTAVLTHSDDVTLERANLAVTARLWKFSSNNQVRVISEEY